MNNIDLVLQKTYSALSEHDANLLRIHIERLHYELARNEQNFRRLWALHTYGEERAVTDKRPHCLYRYFDADDRLLYVGVTHDIDDREQGHRGYSPWRPLAARVTYVWFDDPGAAYTAEKSAIEAERPMHNIQHKPKEPT